MKQMRHQGKRHEVRKAVFQFIKENMADVGISLNSHWDSHNAIHLESESANNAIKLIHLLGSFNGLSLVKPEDCYPNPNGTITFEWKSPTSETVSVEVGNKDMSYYVELHNGVKFYNNIEINAKEIQKLSAYIDVIFLQRKMENTENKKERELVDNLRELIQASIDFGELKTKILELENHEDDQHELVNKYTRSKRKISKCRSVILNYIKHENTQDKNNSRCRECGG
jgi:Fe-S-cluster formation regulator IscX/YfhJ